MNGSAFEQELLNLDLSEVRRSGWMTWEPTGDRRILRSEYKLKSGATLQVCMRDDGIPFIVAYETMHAGQPVRLMRRGRTLTTSTRSASRNWQVINTQNVHELSISMRNKFREVIALASASKVWV